MNRLGFRHDNLRRTLPELLGSPQPEARRRLHALRVGRRAGESRLQRPARAVRAGVLDSSASDLVRSPLRVRHACNSAALLRDSRVWYDAVRPGLLLYGIVPPPLASTIDLTPVMSLTSRVVAVKGLRPGEGVGYGWRYPGGRAAQRCRRPRRLCRWTRYAPVRTRPRADSRTARADRRRGLDGHADRRRHRSRRRCGPETRSCSSVARATRAGSVSTHARWPPRSAPSRGRSSAASAHGLKGTTTETPNPQCGVVCNSQSNALDSVGSWELECKIQLGV